MNASADSAHLLVVDDDARLRGLLQRFLTEQGFRVTAVDSAEDAVVEALAEQVQDDEELPDV